MSQSVFFEGPEKKLEIQFEGLNLLEQPRSYWAKIVDLAKAQILSEIKSDDAVAFLLSESSLFVWKNRIVLITCGATELIKAAEEFYEDFKSHIVSVYFERKNEYDPGAQRSFALEDVSRLTHLFGGEAHRFGRLDDHYVYIFNRSLKPIEIPEVKTLELLIYGIKGEFKKDLEPGANEKTKVMSKMKEIFSSYNLDQFFFDPCGFSLNGLCGAKYVTIHITPQGEESYFSFEMDNFDVAKDNKILQSLLDTCKPSSFDLIYFSKSDEEVLLDLSKYQIKQKSKGEIEAGYKVDYSHYFDPEDVNIKPRLLESGAKNGTKLDH